MAAPGLGPCLLEVRPGRGLLGASVLERQVAQLPTLRRAAVARTETLGGPGDLAAAPGELLQQRLRYPGQLEVAAILPRP